MRQLCLILFSCWLGFAQGVPTEWESKKTIVNLEESMSTVLRSMNALDRESWKQSPAAQSYLQQFESAKGQIESLQQGARELQQRPEELGVALEIFFRLESVDFLLQTVREAAQKFNSSEQADQLAQSIAKSEAERDAFRAYLLDLAKDKDARYRVLEGEAQRCRENVNTPKPPVRRPFPGTKKP